MLWYGAQLTMEHSSAIAIVNNNYGVQSTRSINTGDGGVMVQTTCSDERNTPKDLSSVGIAYMFTAMSLRSENSRAQAVRAERCKAAIGVWIAQ